MAKGDYIGVNEGAVQIKNLPKELRQWFAIRAIRQDRSAQSVYLEALQEYADRHKDEPPDTKP